MGEVRINGRVYHTMDTGTSKVNTSVEELDEGFDEEAAPALPRGKQKKVKPQKKQKVKPQPIQDADDDDFEQPTEMEGDDELFQPHKSSGKKKSNGMLLMIPIIILLAIIIVVVVFVLPKIKAKKDAANAVLNAPAVETTTDEEWDFGEEDPGAVTDEQGVLPESESTEEEWTWEDEDATTEEEWNWDE